MAGLQHDDEALAAIAHTAKVEIKETSDDNFDQYSHELDGIHDGLVYPTDEERATLRRVADTIPWNAYREC